MMRGWSEEGTGPVFSAWLAAAVLCLVPATASASVPSPAALVQSGAPHVYYVGADGQVRQLSRSGTKWIDQNLAAFVSGGEPAASGSSPSVLLDRSGDQHVYYPGANGQMWQYVWNGSQWFNQDLAGFVSGGEPVAAGSTPSVLLDPSRGQHVYYAGTDGAMWQYVWNGSQWFNQDLAGFVSGGEPVASGSSPSVLVDRSGDQHVYYVGANGQIWQYVWDGSHWTNQDLAGFVSGGEPVASGSSPSVLVDPSGGQHVYYVGANGQIWQYAWDGSHWTNQDLARFVPTGEPVASGSSPSVLLDSGGGEHVYYAGANGQVWQYSWNGSRWIIQDLAGFASTHEAVQAGGSPDAVAAGADQHVWYVGANARVWQWLWNGSHWSDGVLGGSPWTPPPPPAPRAATGSTTISAPARRGRVHALLELSWTWRGGHTRVHRIRARHVRAGRWFSVRCRGRGCPRGLRHRRRRPLRRLDGLLFRAGDRLEITVYAPGLLPERFEVRFRFRHRPTGRVL